MKLTIINEQQLDHLVDIGVLYKTRDGTYQNLINHKVWGYVCMPKRMFDDVAGKTIDVKVEPNGYGTPNWSTEVGSWYIQPWMLVDYYDKIKQWGKCRPVPNGEGDNPGIYKYTLRIISRTRLDRLVEKGIVTKEKLGDGYVYKPVITDMGELTMPDIMAEQICGKTLHCKGIGGTTWVEVETERCWSISQWMLDNNYEYLLNRGQGYLNPEKFDEEEEDDEEEEEPEEKEEKEYKRNHVDIVGEIVEKTDNTILVSTEYTDVLVHVTYAPGVGHKVNVEGYLMRTSNMMGYPEVNCTSIQEV